MSHLVQEVARVAVAVHVLEDAVPLAQENARADVKAVAVQLVQLHVEMIAHHLALVGVKEDVVLHVQEHVAEDALLVVQEVAPAIAPIRVKATVIQLVKAVVVPLAPHIADGLHVWERASVLAEAG